jgi:hypothetical protein
MSLETLQSTPSYLWKYTNIHNVKSLTSKEDARKYITNLDVIWNITKIKDGDDFLNSLMQALENNEQQVACDRLFTDESGDTTIYILMFVDKTLPNRIEVGFSYQKTKALGTHNNGLELFSKVLAEYRRNALQNLHFHTNVIRNFYDGSLSDKTPFTSNLLENIHHTIATVKSYYLVCLTLGLCLIIPIIFYLRRRPIKNVLTPLGESIEKQPSHPLNEKEIQADSLECTCRATPSCPGEDEKICAKHRILPIDPATAFKSYESL